MKRAVSGRFSRMSRNPSPSNAPVSPSIVFSPVSCHSGRPTKRNVSGSTLQPVIARAASVTSCCV